MFKAPHIERDVEKLERIQMQQTSIIKVMECKPYEGEVMRYV